MTALVASPLLVPETLASITDLTQDLVRRPSQGGIDDYSAVVTVLWNWLESAGLHPRLLRPASGPAVGVAATIDSGKPGPHLVLDGCLDTAAVGDPASWARDPFSGAVEDGWLHGRGGADSKAALAIFAHLLAELADSGEFTGRLTLLADLDEHTGGFLGIRTFLAQSGPIDGVMIGYPGSDKIVIGGRGVWRARITVHGEAAHSGASGAQGQNAVIRASELALRLQGAISRDVDREFGLPPKLTVTSISGGTSGVWSVVPDRAELEVDVRLTPTFTAGSAEGFVRTLCGELDEDDPAGRRTSVERVGEAWPAFRLPQGHPLPAGLLAGARAAGLDPRLAVAGPSNIGCLLADRGIPATAGFGVTYRGLHGTDEAIELATIPAVYAAYRAAVRGFPDPLDGS